MDIGEIIAGLPDPARDKLPPAVMASKADLAMAAAVEAYEAQFVDIPGVTEERARYILCKSPLVGAYLRKDGDWITTAGGRQVYQKKVSDFVGGVKLAGVDIASHLYVEAKSMAPFKRFDLARLDRPNKKGQKSQQEKLTDALGHGALVWLFLGVWNSMPGTEPVIEERKGRKYTRWKKTDVSAVYYVVDWQFWLDEFLPSLGKRRSFKRKDLEMLGFCKIYKEGRRWEMHPRHWLGEVL